MSASSAAVFGPQKGATPEQIEELEAGLRRLVERTGLQGIAAASGAGAAGGLGFGMMAFFGATLRPGIDIVIVQYKGGGPALTDTIAGQVQMNVGSVIQNLPHVRSGKLKALAVASKRRFAGLPGVPALGETLPGFESIAWFGIVAPPKTSAAIADKVAAGVQEAIKLPDVQKRLADLSAEPMGLGPGETAVFMRQEVERWGAVIRAAGVKLE